ncbi:MAG: alkaline phosphatase D family protein, partial [Planctomycetes bacterium]|nr:alkaline phosphatase D family protein [Planctomycetota bacterium]
MLSKLVCLLVVITSASRAYGLDFVSDFKNTPDRVWIGASYWANPMEDWSINGGRLECRGGANRNLALLTHTLNGRDGFVMSVRLGQLGKAARPGSVGFRIGIRDEIEDYRAAALRGKGISVGVFTRTGTLFIGKTTGGALGNVKALDDLTLTLTGKPAGDRVVLQLIAADKEGKQLASAKSTITSEQLRGLVALVNNREGVKRSFWFSNWKLNGAGVETHKDRAWGPILWAMHTMHNTHTKDGVVLKMTAQLVPMGEKGPKIARLQFSTRDALLEANVDSLACTATFRIENWNPTKDAKYTVHYGDAKYTGTIRAEPSGRPLVVAGFTGNTDYVFPNNAVASNVAVQDPDVLFFSGDQIYESVGGYGIVRAPTDSADDANIRRSTLNYLRKWYLLGWAFGDLMRDRPTICLPDDHDVYQGNIWGEGGLNPHGIRNHAKGGFAEHPKFVNAVIRTQCAHHPDLPDPEPMKQGINVFFGAMVYGRVSFAILEDRYFKSGPEDKVNTWKGRPDHIKDTKYDVTKIDKPGLDLLGSRQEKFLENWAGDWRGADFKCVLSQTIFCNLANYHGPRREFIFADLDSNGWPQTPRNNALRIMRKGYAFHYAGDQHLPSITQNGIDALGDAGFAFCVPSIAAGYPRSW